MMLNLIRIPSIKRLSCLVEGAKGNVYLQLSEEKILDLKKSENIIKDIEDVLRQSENIVIHVFDTRDCLAFANFMVGAAYNESVCR